MANHPLITIASTSRFLSSALGQTFAASLNTQLPLKNIHWKSSTFSTIRTIQELDVIIVPLEHVRDEQHMSQIPVTLLEKPLLNMLIVNCENVDLETYRTVVKKQIKDWQTPILTRKNQEWLIVQVVAPDSKLPTGKLFQLKGSVLDRLRADFNVDKRDRCVQLAWGEGNSDNPQAWAEVLSKIKDGMLTAFDAAVTAREEELKRSEGQKQMPGWNFCSFFSLKETLAGSYEGFNLYEDALLQYEELEALFLIVSKEGKNLSWFGSLIQPTPRDDSSALLSISKKPYRDFIMANTITVFDLRIYLLAKQCGLLAKLGKLAQVTHKSAAFLNMFGKRLQEVESTIPENFIESWTYSSALSVVDQCDAWITELALSGSRDSEFLAGQGELVELARHQLDILGVLAGHLPNSAPFSISTPHLETRQQTRSPMRISRIELLNALDDRNAFYELYISTTNRAIDLYARASRRKFAIRLHGSLAALDLHRGRLEPALTTYKSLPAHYAPHMWSSLETYMLARALDTHQISQLPTGADWIHITLSFLKAFVDTGGSNLLIHEADKDEYLIQLINSLRTSAGTLEDDVINPDHPALSLKVLKDATSLGDRDGFSLDVCVVNRLLCTLPVDRIEVSLTGKEASSCRFTCDIDELRPGPNNLTLFCPASVHGNFVLHSSEVRMSKLVFRHLYYKTTTSAKSAPAKPILIKLPRDSRALDIRLRPPFHIELGSRPSITLELFSGRNEVEMATITLSPGSGPAFSFEEAQLHESAEDITLTPTSTSLALAKIPPNREVMLCLPFADSSQPNILKVWITVEYTTGDEPELIRKYCVNRELNTGLPISVNVEDFFRARKAFSAFVVSTTSHQHVRIRTAKLEPRGKESTSGLNITSSRSRETPITTVTPSQPGSFLFCVESPDGPVLDPLNFIVTYRILREEIECLVKRAVNAATESQDQRDIIFELIIQALSRSVDWVEMYRITEEIHIPPLTEVMEDVDADVLQGALETLRQKQDLECLWRTITIPVDLPHLNIAAAAKLTVKATHSSLYAGQPIQAVISIETSLHWGQQNPDQKYSLRYDIEEVARDWLISGDKRGDFEASDGSTYTVPITLIALRHGEIRLPKVFVTALPSDGEKTMGSVAIPTIDTHQVHGAEKVLVLPRGGRSTYVVHLED